MLGFFSDRDIKTIIHYFHTFSAKRSSRRIYFKSQAVTVILLISLAIIPLGEKFIASSSQFFGIFSYN